MMDFNVVYKIVFREKIRNIHFSGVILEEYIKFEKFMAGNVVKVYVNTVEISILIWNNVKDLLSLYSFPKVTEGVLNTNNFSAYRISKLKSGNISKIGTLTIKKRTAFKKFEVVVIKFRVPNKILKESFYLFTIIILYLVTLGLWLSLLARLSLMANLLGFCVKSYVQQDKNIAAKYTLQVLLFFTKNRIFCRILLFCANFSHKFFNYKYGRIIDIIIVNSKIILVIGSFLRILLAHSYPLPYPGLLFFLLGVNGIFRATINLGLLLTSGDRRIKEFLEILKRNSGKNIPTPFSEPINNNNQNIISEQKKKNFNVSDLTALTMAYLTLVSLVFITVTEKTRFYEKNLAEYKRLYKESLADEKRLYEERVAEYKRFYEECVAEYKCFYEENLAEGERINKKILADNKRFYEKRLADYERNYEEIVASYERKYEESMAYHDGLYEENIELIKKLVEDNKRLREEIQKNKKNNDEDVSH